MPVEGSRSDCAEMAPRRSFCWRWISVRRAVARPVPVPPRWSPVGSRPGPLQPWSHAGRGLVTPPPEDPAAWRPSEWFFVCSPVGGVLMRVVLVTFVGVIEVSQTVSIPWTVRGNGMAYVVTGSAQLRTLVRAH